MGEIERFGHIIDGEEVDSFDGARFDSVNPWTRQVWASIALGSSADADRAVTAARSAFDSGPWPRMGYAERQRLINRFADLLEEHADEIGSADSQDMGKPLAQCRHDVARAAWNFRFFAEHAKLATGETYPMDSGHHAYSRFEPAGVVVAIAPWNFPLMLESWKVAPALAWGNTVVLKPAEDTPVSGILMARLATEAGFPPGVFNVVNGYGPDSVGSALTQDPRVDRITFTGESGTGRIIAAAAAKNLTPVSLELGGKNANIVFADADLDNAVDWSIQSIFRNAGQICLSGSRLYVERGVYEDFLARFKTKAEAMQFGDPLDPDTDLGPLISRRQQDSVAGFVTRAVADGATVKVGGQIPGGELARGSYYRPTLVVDAAQHSEIVQEEIFGPVLVVLPFDDDDEAFRLANDSPYGLASSAWTTSHLRAQRATREIAAGCVWVNDHIPIISEMPHGGFKSSGFGKDMSVYSFEEYTQVKHIMSDITGVARKPWHRTIFTDRTA